MICWIKENKIKYNKIIPLLKPHLEHQMQQLRKLRQLRGTFCSNCLLYRLYHTPI